MKEFGFLEKCGHMPCGSPSAVTFIPSFPSSSCWHRRLENNESARPWDCRLKSDGISMWLTSVHVSTLLPVLSTCIVGEDGWECLGICTLSLPLLKQEGCILF